MKRKYIMIYDYDASKYKKKYQILFKYKKSEQKKYGNKFYQNLKNEDNELIGILNSFKNDIIPKIYRCRH